MPLKSIVLDANILIRAVLGPRVRNLILQNYEETHFFAPEICISDAQKYLPEIFRKRHLDVDPIMTLFEELKSLMNVVESEIYEEYEKEAKARLKNRDIEDWPIVSTALLLNCAIWTEDRDFFGSGIPIWTTDRIHIFLSD
jgi:predicted nucleic acid-binding protein